MFIGSWSEILFPFLGAIVNMLVGFIWYSPVLFGKPWAKLMGMKDMSPEQMRKGIGKIYGLMFLSSIVSSYVFMLVLIRMNPNNIFVLSLILGVLVWLGFVSTVQFGNWLFSKKPFQLFLIDTGYQLVSYVALSVLATVLLPKFMY
jgi:hypothetical protein